jgi:hypothetical protein
MNMNSLFWDIEVYEFAITSFENGMDPYIDRQGFDFLYPPLVLDSLVFINKFIPIEIFIVGSTIAGLWYLIRSFAVLEQISIKGVDVLFLSLFLSFGYFSWGYLGFFSGNLSTLGHLIILGVFLHYLHRPIFMQGLMLYIVIIIFSLIKPYFLAYSLLLLIKDFKKAFVCAVLTSSFTVGIWYFSSLDDQSMFQSFLQNLTAGTINNDDLGYSIFSLLYAHYSLSLSIISHVILFCIGLVIYFKRISILGIVPSVIWLSSLSILSNPRVKEYDLIILFILFVMSSLMNTSKFGFRKFEFVAYSNFVGALLASVLVVWTTIDITFIEFLGTVIVLGSIYRNLRGKEITQKSVS